MDARAPVRGDASTSPAIFRVVTKRWEFDGTASLEIEAPAGAEGWRPASPGQFAMLYAFGVGEAAFSFSALPARPRRYICTIRNAGAVSAALTRLKTGDAVGLRGPFGKGWPIQVAEDHDVVVIAGGLGLAPLRPAIEHLSMVGARSLHLLYGARNPATILFKRDLEYWRNKKDIDVRVIVDAAGPDWTGDVGLVTTLIDETEFEPARSCAFVCGPEVMMRFSAEALLDAGLPAAAIWISMERNMKCAVGFCGHCQFGPAFVCKDGPVFRYDGVRDKMFVKEL